MKLALRLPIQMLQQSLQLWQILPQHTISLCAPYAGQFSWAKQKSEPFVYLTCCCCFVCNSIVRTVATHRDYSALRLPGTNLANFDPEPSENHDEYSKRTLALIFQRNKRCVFTTRPLIIDTWCYQSDRIKPMVGPKKNSESS